MERWPGEGTWIVKSEYMSVYVCFSKPEFIVADPESWQDLRMEKMKWQCCDSWSPSHGIMALEVMM